MANIFWQKVWTEIRNSAHNYKRIRINRSFVKRPLLLMVSLVALILFATLTPAFAHTFLPSHRFKIAYPVSRKVKTHRAGIRVLDICKWLIMYLVSALCCVPAHNDGESYVCS